VSKGSASGREKKKGVGAFDRSRKKGRRIKKGVVSFESHSPRPLKRKKERGKYARKRGGGDEGAECPTEKGSQGLASVVSKRCKEKGGGGGADPVEEGGKKRATGVISSSPLRRWRRSLDEFHGSESVRGKKGKMVDPTAGRKTDWSYPKTPPERGKKGEGVPVKREIEEMVAADSCRN